MTKVNLKNILTAVRDMINRSSENAIRKAQSAEKQAGAAQATANNAQTAADNAQTTAEAAQTTADNAQTAAATAQTTADSAKTAAATAQTAADNAKTAADNAVGADVVKGNYILRTGQPKYAGYGFSVLYKNSDETETELSYYGPTGIKLSDTTGTSTRVSITTHGELHLGSNSGRGISALANIGSSTSACLSIRNDAESSLFLYGNGVISSGNHIIKLGSYTSANYLHILRYVKTPEESYDAANKEYVDKCQAANKEHIDNVQVVANNSRDILNDLYLVSGPEETRTFEFDGITTGLESFSFLGDVHSQIKKYYKISDFTLPGRDKLLSAVSISEDGTQSTTTTAGVNCSHIGSGIIVYPHNSSETCSIFNAEFYAGAGIYLPWEDGMETYKVNTITITYADASSALQLISSTIGSTKKFKITVDDSGTISATEVT